MRTLLLGVVASSLAICFCGASAVGAETAEGLQVATFRCDITPPLGQPMFACDPLRTVEQPLLAKGVVIEAAGKRYVLCALDWCELCNGTHEALQNMIAAAAATEPARVAVQCVHQHTAPLVDVDAQKLLAEVGAPQLMLEPKVFDEIAKRLAAEVKRSLEKLEPFDQIGVGQAKVDRVASNRRVVGADGKIHTRYSVCLEKALRALPEGTIDPFLKTVTLAQGEKPLVRLHYYATHPQTRYRDNRASSDIVGDAREAIERKERVFQIYFTGCAGDITVGKYNNGDKQRRKELAARLQAGMEASVAATKFVSAGPIRWRTCLLPLPARTDAGFIQAEDIAGIKDLQAGPIARMCSALNLVFLRRKERPIEASSLEIGDVYLLHLPGEPTIGFQFFAQTLRPGAFVAVAGYGDGGPGYLCPAAAYREGGYEPTASRVTPESEAIVKKAIGGLLGVEN